jgi:heavy metal sensor kinase
MRSPRSRVVWGVTVWVGVLGVVLAWVAWREVSAAWRRDLDQLLRDKASLLAKSLNRANPREVYVMKEEMQRDELGYFGQGFDTNQVFLWKSQALPEPIPLNPPTVFLARQHLAHQFEDLDHPKLGRLRAVTYPVWEVRDGRPMVFAFVQVLMPRGAFDVPSQAVAGRLAVAVVLAVVLAGLGTYSWVTRWLGDSARVTETALELAERGELTGRLPVPGGDPEAASLARALNRMLGMVQRAWENERRFIADASHELRTPLTILLGEIEVILRRDREPEDYRAVLRSNREEVGRLSRLADNLLFLARMDAGPSSRGEGAYDLGQAAREAIARRTGLSEARDVEVRYEGPDEGPRVPLDAESLDRVVGNLLENAIRYSPADEAVTVRVGGGGGAEAVLAVEDHGHGIAPEHLPRLFERFYRVDTSRARAEGGAGLGLAIVKSLVEAQGGRVEVESRLGWGTIFTVRLPEAARGSGPGGDGGRNMKAIS